MICDSYFMVICEKVFIILLIMYCGILRSTRCFMVGVCMDPRMLAMIIIEGGWGRIVHPCYVHRGSSSAYLFILQVAAALGNLPL